MAEWTKATVSKTVDPSGSGGSNPSLSASQILTRSENDLMRLLNPARFLVVACALAFVTACSTPASVFEAGDSADARAASDVFTETQEMPDGEEESPSGDVEPDSGYEPDLAPPWKCAEPDDCALIGPPGTCMAYECSPEHLCLETPVVDGSPCLPDDPCMNSGSCESGECLPDAAVVCDDGNPCTAGLCNQTDGCVYKALEGECNDGNQCTGPDICTAGECSGPEVTCEDDNSCTTDSCDPASGCLFTNSDGECDDGDPCTTGDTCQGGDCIGLQNLCECHADEECETIAKGDLCILAVACNTDELPYFCEAIDEVACEPTGTLCATNTCDPNLGECVLNIVAQDEECVEPANCVPAGTCQDGTCVGPPPDCDDNNFCTADACVLGQGCVNAPLTIPCDDQDPCTINDFCSPEGLCAGLDTGCQVIPPLGLRLTTLVFEKPGFCLPGIDGECVDATALVNSFVNDDLNDPDSPLIMLGLFDPFDLAGDSSLFYLGPGACDIDAGQLGNCTFPQPPASMAPVAFALEGQCELTESPEVDPVPAPCFHVAGDTIQVGIMNIVVPVGTAQVTGTFVAMPEPTSISQGHISAFLKQETADLVKVSLPLMPFYYLSELLNPDDLTELDGEPGWHMLINFSADVVEASL